MSNCVSTVIIRGDFVFHVTCSMDIVQCILLFVETLLILGSDQLHFFTNMDYCSLDDGKVYIV